MAHRAGDESDRGPIEIDERWISAYVRFGMLELDRYLRHYRAFAQWLREHGLD